MHFPIRGASGQKLGAGYQVSGLAGARPGRRPGTLSERFRVGRSGRPSAATAPMLGGTRSLTPFRPAAARLRRTQYDKSVNDDRLPEQPTRPEPPDDEAKPGEAWRPRRPSPLGLMGPAESQVPKANPWPSLRAVGFMILFIAIVVALLLLFSRG